MSQQALPEFIATLAIPDEARQQLPALTPAAHTGCAAQPGRILCSTHI
ncbi:MAG: hypothetical protein WA924_02470 [Burkholderiaceae bacterium]